MTNRYRITYLLFSLAIAGCTPDTGSQQIPAVSAVHFATAPTQGDEFGDYWYQGEAELTSYELEQARYGELHDGHAVLIFVSEDFSRKKHVKLDNPQEAGDDKVNILKLNATKKFTTGIYPYSMMSSVFTPIQGDGFPRTLKVTTSSQEWCGHTFTQINLNRDKYKVEMHSYFEREGDQNVKLEGVMLEDEVWTAIRLAPNSLPIGKTRMIPGTMYQRLGHEELAVQQVETSMTEQEGDLMTYSITYPDHQRTLRIHFNKSFPHEIEGWEETTTSRSGELTTIARKKKRIMLDYWSHNNVADLPLRADLELD